MTRPQHRFYSGLNYLEVDLDVHCYAYLARRGLHRLFPRMVSGTFDFGFVIQVNLQASLNNEGLRSWPGHQFNSKRDNPGPWQLPLCNV